MEKKKAAITILDMGLSFDKEKRILSEHGIEADYIPLEGTNDANKIVSCMKGYDFVLAGPELWSREVIEGVKGKLKMIVRLGTGVDKVDIAAATKYGIAVCNTPGTNACSVAQHALALMLDLSMSVTRYDRNMRKGKVNRTYANDLIGKTVGLLGFGSISKELAQLLSGFRVRILYYDIVRNDEIGRRFHAEYVELDELIGQSDYISLHLPLTQATEGLVDIDFLKRMKPTAYLINTSRGGIVKESDLVEALRRGMIAGAGLDVFENQPLSQDSPLLELENVVLTPYVAFSSRLGNDRTFETAINSVLDYCWGREIKNLLNPGYKSNLMNT